uniref:Protein brown n=1 Tax=Culex pipiens TaxID=7175 RepID=A0A8D7ZXK3_CULPI
MAIDFELNDSIRIYKPAAEEGTTSASSPVLLEWMNLSVRIGSGRTWSFKKKPADSAYILKHATGAVRSGDLVAVMGSSGSGKTTMLAAVSMRLTADVQGSVLINGLFVNPTQMKRLSGFVPQFEIALNSLTVREHLTFVAKLKGVGRAQMKSVINELNLEQCASTRISHLSGGERKKVNLAGELLTEPDVLFCDEPTTGLDSFSALAVINTLRKLAVDSRKAVICTIHHPTSDIFECFSDIILLNRGRTYYQGPTVEATSFFESISLPLPINCNPADYYFKLVCDSDGYDNVDSSESLAGESRNRHEVVRKCQRENVAKKSLMGPYQQGDVIDKLCRNTSHACWPSQLYLLLHRGILDSIRNLREYIIVTFLFLITSITISALYFHIDPATGGQTSIQDIRGALFLVVCELLYTLSYSVFYVFPRDLPLVRREVGERTYRLSAYYAHRALLTVPKAFFESFLFVGILYGCVRFTAVAGAATYVGMATVSAVASLLAVAYGYLLTCLSGSMELSIEYANLIFLLYGLLGGLYLNIRAFPVAKYLSFFFFAAEGISVYYWRTVLDIPCDLDETTTTAVNETATNHSCLRDGLAVLEDTGYGTSLDVVYFNYLVMAGQIVAVHVLAYFCLRRLVKKAGFY